MKTWHKASMVLISGLIMAACGQKPTEPPAAAPAAANASTDGTIGLAISTQNNPFFVSLKMVRKKKQKNWA